MDSRSNGFLAGSDFAVSNFGLGWTRSGPDLAQSRLLVVRNHHKHGVLTTSKRHFLGKKFEFSFPKKNVVARCENPVLVVISHNEQTDLGQIWSNPVGLG